MKRLPSLLDNCTSGGCGAKISPGELSSILSHITQPDDENLLIGFRSSDDAAVYRIDDTRSLISTVDFFPPMVDDARTFGRIAAANALSDIYAMGGKPLFALNLLCFPEALEHGLPGEVLTGGAEKCAEAGVPLAGGHSIYDKEIKYGLAVTGVAETDRIYRNNTPRPGDMLILTKPLGVGIIMAAHRAGEASAQAVGEAVASMERLNKYACEKLSAFDISACTDVTGFGFIVHLLEMTAGKVSAEIFTGELPGISFARDYAKEFLLTAAGQRNRVFAGSRADTGRLPFWMQEILFDPQTSGGLLIAVSAPQAETLLGLIRADDPRAAVVGEFGRLKDCEITFC